MKKDASVIICILFLCTEFDDTKSRYDNKKVAIYPIDIPLG